MNFLASPSDYTALASVTLLGDTSFTKYRYHDGFDDEPRTYTFWAVTGNGAEVWYDDERLYDALDEIERLRAELEKFSYADTINGMELWEKCDDPVD